MKRFFIVIAGGALAVTAVGTTGVQDATAKSVRTKNLAAVSVAQRANIGRSVGQYTGRQTRGGETSDAELNLMCGGDWFLMYEEDANGNPVTGTCIIACDGNDIPFC